MKIYVGNMSYEVEEDELQQVFSEFGQVVSVNVIKDKLSGRSKGFGFVEMADREAGQAAIEGLNGKDLQGRIITVSEARPQTNTRNGHGGGAGDGRGGNRGGAGGGGRGGQGQKGNFGGGRGGGGGQGQRGSFGSGRGNTGGKGGGSGHGGSRGGNR